MKSPKALIIVFLSTLFITPSCGRVEKSYDLKIIFLHHSTGKIIWNGNKAKKMSLPLLFENYNKENQKKYLIREIDFPKSKPYGWRNYPYDYYNIWVKNAGDNPFMEEPTLEMLTKEYQVIIFKHCFPVSNIREEESSPDINSDLKTISNYKVQYDALRNKLHEFPDTKFILFTGAAQVKANITEEAAEKAKEFFRWVTEKWDLPDDNIYIWDLYSIQTDGGLYFEDKYAISPNDPHPNKDFAGKASKLLFDRTIDIIENNGNGTKLTGERK